MAAAGGDLCYLEQSIRDDDDDSVMAIGKRTSSEPEDEDYKAEEDLEYQTTV